MDARNPVVATLMSAVALALLVGFLVSSYFASNFWNARKQYVADQIAQFSQYDRETFDARVATLAAEPFRNATLGALLSEWQSASDNHHRDRVAAAILRFDRTLGGSRPPQDVIKEAERHLLNSMLSTDDPANHRFAFRELSACVAGVPNGEPLERATYVEESGQRTDDLWDAANRGDKPTTRIRALIALSAHAPDDERWSNQAIEDLANGLLGFEAKQIGAWTALSTGVSDRLMPIMSQIRQSGEPPQRRARAERAYVALATSPVDKVQRLMRTSSPELVRELVFDLQMREMSSDERSDVLSALSKPRADATPMQVANQSLAKLILDGPVRADELTIFGRRGDRRRSSLF